MIRRFWSSVDQSERQMAVARTAVQARMLLNDSVRTCRAELCM